MAEEDTKPTEGTDAETKKDTKAQKGDDGKKGLIARFLPGVLIVVISAGAGVAANMLLPQHSPPVLDETPSLEEAETIVPSRQETQMNEDFEYYAFEPVTVNLNTQRQNRYLNVKVLLAIRANEKNDVFPQIDRKKIVLKNWLMAYLKDLDLDEVSGRKNLLRIQREIADAFNEQLWPDDTVHIDHVLFDDFFVK
jgi:flagellar basal body-associated protein FliL